MSHEYWSELHKGYLATDWISKPSLFAETAVEYFPAYGKVLELGAGVGQDSHYFADRGFEVVSTDLEDTTLQSIGTNPDNPASHRITVHKVDMQDPLPFPDASFDVVYSHLSLHYFDKETTKSLFREIKRVLKAGGVLAFLANSVNDPEYDTGEKLEEDFYRIGAIAKRYFSLDSTRYFTQYYNTTLLDDHGETYKDQAKGVHSLIRFIGTKPIQEKYPTAIPFCGALIEREINGEIEILMQTRWKPSVDPVYSGTLEFPAGVLDKPFEDVHETLAREIKEEAGLTLKSIHRDSRTPILNTSKDDGVIGFQPFCCTQQLRNGRPWIGFIFVCEVEPGEPSAQLSETKDVRWMKKSELKEIYEKNPEKLFALELPAWSFYFKNSH